MGEFPNPETYHHHLTPADKLRDVLTDIGRLQAELSELEDQAAHGGGHFDHHDRIAFLKTDIAELEKEKSMYENMLTGERVPRKPIHFPKKPTTQTGDKKAA